MVVLALETATRRGSMALWRDGRCVGRPGASTATHGQRLPGELADWVRTEGLSLAEIDVFAITAGPGSFTGLRVGMAAIQGLALPLGRRVIPVPTLEAVAEAWLGPTAPTSAIVAPWMDGQRGDIFLAAYDVREARTMQGALPMLEPVAGPPAQVVPPLVASAAGRPLILIGDAAQRHAAAIRALAPAARFESPVTTLAEATASLAARRLAQAVAPHGVGPTYVRRPDAETARDRFRARASSAGAGLVVRAARPADLPAVAALQGASFTNPWSVDAIRWELDHTDVARLYVLVAPADRVVAYCACWIVFDELHINSLAVEHGERRRGLARRLLEEVFRQAVDAGARSATLEVRESNVAARQLYEGLGFRVEARRRDYYQAPREDALVLWHRRLDGAGAV